MRWLWSFVTAQHNGEASQVSITANGEKGHWVSRQQKPLKNKKGDAEVSHVALQLVFRRKK